MINVINFLPNDYLARRTRRRANLTCVVLAGSSLLTLAVVVGFMAVQAVGAARMRELVDRQYEDASKQLEQLRQLEDRKGGLMHKMELSTDLLERVPRSLLLARLTNYLPKGTSLMVLTMKTEEVEVKEAPAAKGGKTPADADKKTAGTDKPKAAAKAAPAGRKKPEVVKTRRFVFRLDGLAPTDVEVAAFLSHLSADPIFQDVDLQFSEDFPYKENVRMRRFQVNFRLRQEAAKIIESGMATGVVSTPPAPDSPRGDS